MSWDGYLPNLMAPNSSGTQEVMEAAICGYDGSVWCGTGNLLNIKPEEIKKIASQNRGELPASGVTIGGAKCTLIGDRLDEENMHTMNLRTKKTETDDATYSVSIYKTKSAFVIVKGLKDVTVPATGIRAAEVGQYLRGLNI